MATRLTFSYADYYLVLIVENNNKVYYHFPYFKYLQVNSDAATL